MPTAPHISRTAEHYFPQGHCEDVPRADDMYAYMTPAAADVWLVLRDTDGAILKARASQADAERDCEIPGRKAVHRSDLTWAQACELCREQDRKTRPTIGRQMRMCGSYATAVLHREMGVELQKQPRYRRTLETYQRIREIVEQQPGLELREVIELLGDKHHWANSTVIHGCLTGTLQRQRLPGVRAEWSEDGSECWLWVREDKR